MEPDNKVWPLVAIAFTGAFAIRFYLAFNANIITPDGILYIKTARLIESGDWQNTLEFSFIHLYLFLIVLAQKIIPDWETAARMVSVLMGSLATIPFFLLVKDMFGLPVAAMSTLFYAINPRFADYSADVLREPTFWFFSMTSIWLAWRGLSMKKPAMLVISSVFTGLSAFARIEGAAVFIVILLWICLKLKGEPKKTFQYLIIFIFAFPVLILPAVVIFIERTGRWEFLGFTIQKIWFLLTKSSTDFLELTPDMLYVMPVELFHFIELAKDQKYIIFFSDIIFKIFKSLNVVFALFAIIGIFYKRNSNNRKNEILIAIWFGVFFIMTYIYILRIYHLSTRHALLMGMPLLIFAGIGFFELKQKIYSWFQGLSISNFINKNLTTIFIMIILAAILPKTLSPGGYDKIEMKKAGIHLKNIGFEDKRFAGEPSLFRIAFYADSEYSALSPVKNNEELVLFMKEKKVDFLIFDENTSTPFYKKIQGNIDNSIFEKLEVPEFKKLKEYKISIYRLKKDLS